MSDIDYRNDDPKTEAVRQREYSEGLKLLEKAWLVLRVPLNVNEAPELNRDEVKFARVLRDAREMLHKLISEREKKGIRSAPPDPKEADDLE